MAHHFRVNAFLVVSHIITNLVFENIFLKPEYALELRIVYDEESYSTVLYT